MNINLPAGHVGESGLANLMYLMYTHALHASSHIAAILLKTGRRTLTMLSFLKIENVMEGVAGDE